MATVTGDMLPPLLMERLGVHSAPGTTHPAHLEGMAVPVCTIDPDGLPHPAMLSYTELAADDTRSMRAAVYGESTTARHLRQQGRIALLFVDPEGTYYVKATVTGPDTPHPTARGVAVFPLAVVAVLADAVDTSREPAAVITSGIRFRRTAPGTTP
ncbi:MAG: pyridoxamine 5'-phosphate oxidase family protein [Vicinamibacteria bacterium]|nr:pyridoxamine 5'-phosphate oxidase family protein [Vicinamibacteria bacterium]